MTQVTIRVLEDGPYEVSGRPALVDFEARTYAADEDPIYLCRCDRSANKPYCDGTHKKVGFQAAECVRMAPGR